MKELLYFDGLWLLINKGLDLIGNDGEVWLADTSHFREE